MTARNFLSWRRSWIRFLGGATYGGEKNVIANLFSAALWTWCHSTKLITLHWLFVSNEILLKKCGCRIKKPRNLKSPHPGGGDGNYHTWYSPVCKTNGVIAARVRVKDQISRLPRHRWPQVKITSNKCVNPTLRFVWALHRGRELIMLKSETDSRQPRPTSWMISAEISCSHCVCKALLGFFFFFFFMGLSHLNT